MKKYKLLSQDMTSYGGFEWVLGKTYEIEKPGNSMCTDQVFHFYDSPEIAALMNPVHANIENPRLFECEVPGIVTHDGLKGGCKSMTLTSELPVPEFSTEQRVKFGILCAKKVCTDKKWNEWADNWLSGKDRDAYAADAARAACADQAAWAAAKWINEIVEEL